MDDKTEALAAQLKVHDAGAVALGVALSGKFNRYEQDRRLAELKWARNARQILGIYDPEVEKNMDPNKSKAYPKITRVKCVSMLSRLMNLLFPTDDKNWTVAPSPVPELSTEDLQAVLSEVDAATKAQDPQATPTNEQIEAAIRALADKRATRLELEIADQLQELGGSRSYDYVALARKVLASGIQYGLGVLKGPSIEMSTQRSWSRDANGMLVATETDVERPRFEFVSVWDYYPDMTAKTFAQAEGQFQRIIISKHQLELLKKREDFLTPQINKVLATHPTGNYKRRAFETEIKAMGVQNSVGETDSNKYEAIVWEGFVPEKQLTAAGISVPENKTDEDVRAVVWVVDSTPIKITLDPWTELLGDEAPNMFHQFIFEEDESSLTGTGLPNIMRDSQMSVCAGARMVLDNGAIACGMNLEVNLGLLLAGQDTKNITPNKVWYRDDENVATATLPAVKAIEIPSRVVELKTIVDMFSAFADQETFVNPATGGDTQKGSSEPFRSAAGASLMKGDAALPFKDVVRSFDLFTQSVIGALIAFNKQFNKNKDVAGDFRPVARGATSLIAKEVLGIQLDNLANTLTDEEKMFVDMHGLAKARVRVRDLQVKDLVVDDDEAKRRIDAKVQQDAAAQATQQKMIEAQIREVLSQTLKNLSQAGKNSAAAEATTANVILNAMEKGVSPDAVANQGTGSSPAGQDSVEPAGNGGGSGAAAPPTQAGEVPDGLSIGSAGAPAAPAGGSQNAGFAAIPNAEAGSSLQ